MMQRDPLRQIIESPLKPLPYLSHPSDAILRDYVHGRLSQGGSLDVAGLQGGSMTTWHRAEVTAHLLTCPRCAQVVLEWRREPAPSSLRALLQSIRSQREPVPAFARAVMLIQSVLIIGLMAVIYFKPAPFFSPQNPTASISQEVKKSHQQSPAPYPQGIAPVTSEVPDDPIFPIVRSYPLTVRIALREDTPVQELERLVESINGILILMRRNGFIMRLSSDNHLDSVIEKLSQSPYIREVRKD